MKTDTRELNNEKYKMIFERLSENPEIKKTENIFSEFFGDFKMLVLEKGAVWNARKLSGLILKPSKTDEPMINASFTETIRGAVKRATRSGKIELFNSPLSGFGFCQLLIDDEEVFGYIIAYHIDDEPSASIISLFECFIRTILSGIKKEVEMDDLYKTIKPRAIALSTVHTIHRLITSTIHLDELLSRLARLCMQVIKTNRCSIKLVDSKKKTLLPKATVDVRTKDTKLKKVKIGRWAPGKAVKYGRSIRSDKYLATPLIDENVIGVITLYDKIDKKPFDNFDEEIMRTLGEQAAIAIKNAQLYKAQEQMTMGSIKALAHILESRSFGICSPKTCFLRMAHLMGQEMGMRELDLTRLQYATMLHDAGELLVPERLLKKKGRLTSEEYKLIKEHPLKGAKIIKSLKSLKAITPIIMYHHENFNGTGYPKGLKGAEIPLGARIMAVVAAFEAMITRRPYRVPLTIKKASEEVRKNSGRQFDPKVVDVFLKVMARRDMTKLLNKEHFRTK
ncbi:MAG: HD domain-containing phosphohydrolase [Candidatus Omnitrophota bacterium]